MSDNKSLAVILGTIVGVGVALTIGTYLCRCHEPVVQDVNEIFDQARRTVRELDRTIDALRESTA
ncbi:MAG: hypothetical protein A2Z18_06875 [Armatimonadetes bacterium RBG_16_58_9]|nr:MAG: hypothetical protein A2Z18_06875 [Armatimonadetes bacterium RBG_16_58_9]